MPQPGDIPNLFDGLDLTRRRDRIIALQGIQSAAAASGEWAAKLSRSAKDEEPPTAKQLESVWMALACTNAAVSGVARVLWRMEECDD